MLLWIVLVHFCKVENNVRVNLSVCEKATIRMQAMHQAICDHFLYVFFFKKMDLRQPHFFFLLNGLLYPMDPWLAWEIFFHKHRCIVVSVVNSNRYGYMPFINMQHIVE